MLVHELLSFGDPDRLAVCDQGRSYTYRELRDLVRRCRNALYVQGVRQQTPVALFSRKTVHYIVAYLAIASLGAIAVPVNSQLSQREVGYILRDSGTRLLLTGRPSQPQRTWTEKSCSCRWMDICRKRCPRLRPCPPPLQTGNPL